MATEQQSRKLAGIIVEHSSIFQVLSTEDVQWAIQNPQDTMSLLQKALHGAFVLQTRAAKDRLLKAVASVVKMEQLLDHYGVLKRFKRSQDSLVGPCPIHDGTNPMQFRVSVSKNQWNCFSQCHCGGDVLDFVIKMEDLSPLLSARDSAATRLIDWFQLDPRKLSKS